LAKSAYATAARSEVMGAPKSACSIVARVPADSSGVMNSSVRDDRKLPAPASQDLPAPIKGGREGGSGSKDAVAVAAAVKSAALPPFFSSADMVAGGGSMNERMNGGRSKYSLRRTSLFWMSWLLPCRQRFPVVLSFCDRTVSCGKAKIRIFLHSSSTRLRSPDDLA
jgi:hypothetical protein